MSYSTAAKQGPNTIISGQDSPFSQCQGGEKSMAAYLVCCHMTGTVSGVLFHTDNDTWAGREFYAAECHGQRIHLPLQYVRPLMVYTREPEATLSFLLVLPVRERGGIAVRQT